MNARLINSMLEENESLIGCAKLLKSLRDLLVSQIGTSADYWYLQNPIKKWVVMTYDPNDSDKIKARIKKPWNQFFAFYVSCIY